MPTEGTPAHTDNGIRRKGQHPVFIPIEDLIARYLAGESENILAAAYDVSRRTITKRLIAAGIERRGILEANRLMMARRTPEEHARNTRAAHTAVIGRRCSFEERCRCAMGRELCPSNVGPEESRVQEILARHGIATIPQRAIGHYNCDLAAIPVAVEIWGGNFHWTHPKFAREIKRLHYLLNTGWHIYILDIWHRQHRLTETACDDLVAFIKLARANPSLRREYRVVWGTGELIASGSANDNQDTIKEALTRAKDSFGLNHLTRG